MITSRDPSDRPSTPTQRAAPWRSTTRRRTLGSGAIVALSTMVAVMRSTRATLGWWSLPLIVFLLTLAALLLVVAVAQPLAPFLYPLF